MITDKDILKEKLADLDEPHFFIMDLNNYTDDFLREIILWMDKKIKVIEKYLEEAEGK